MHERQTVKVLFDPMLTDFRKVYRCLKGSQESLVCPSGRNNIYVKMSMEHWWNDTEVLGGKPV